MLNSMVDNAYVHGKEYITNTIRDSIEEKDPEKALQIEKQVIELWDRVYLSWNKTWENFNDSTKVCPSLVEFANCKKSKCISSMFSGNWRRCPDRSSMERAFGNWKSSDT